MRGPILDREEYIEQEYFFRVYRERLEENVPSQEILRLVQEEISGDNAAADGHRLSCGPRFCTAAG